MNLDQFEQRKKDHIQESLNPANQAVGFSGLESVHLTHDALPEIDFEDVSLMTVFQGVDLKTPFFVSGMTAGHKGASLLNEVIAEVAQQRGWMMGVGSQRRELEHTSPQDQVDEWKKFRSKFPTLSLISNIGASQLVRFKVEDFNRLLNELKPQALAIHLNALQEVMQPEGTPHFRGVIEAIQKLSSSLSVPLLLKETGCGFSEKTLHKVKELKISALDVSGLGGTHWGRIEGKRSEVKSMHALASETFSNWGESTKDSVVRASQILPNSVEVWASGGVRSGLDAAKLIALGAHRVGYAKPVLEHALIGCESLNQWMQLQEFELKTALFCTGSKSLNELRESKCLRHQNS